MLVPVWREIAFDLDTPLAAFHRVKRGASSFLLESAPAGGESWSRFSYLGTEPRAAWRLADGRIEDWNPSAGWHNPREGDPLDDLERTLELHTAAPNEELSRLTGGFWGGAVGFFGYDIVRSIEHLPHAPGERLDVPDAMFLFTDVLVVVDSLRSRAILVACVPSEDETASAEAVQLAESRLDEIHKRLRQPGSLRPLRFDGEAVAASGRTSRTREDFEADVRRIKDYIVAGDAFQVLLARRIQTERDFDSTTLYRALRGLNPSPYMFHLELEGMELVGSSPELLVRLQGRRIVVRPIAGTRRRHGDPEADERLSRELLEDEKERAEHLMLVDLGRNDIGRVARFGSVVVTELMRIERYSHVLHIVSQVEGELSPGVSSIGALRATFPAGTMTGAPKVRAMEIIDELEPVRRGPYAGAVGYISADGARMDLAITIRTCVLAGNSAFVQAGAGIVHDSVPEREWEETETKASAMLTAIARARTARFD